MESYNRLSRLPRIRRTGLFLSALILTIMTSCLHLAYGQIPISVLNGAQLNAIQTSVPFLTLAPDGRASGMGDIGVASTPDINSQHWNVGKYAFAEKRGGAALSFTPWATNLIPGIYLFNLAGYHKLNEKNAFSGSIRYFSLKTINFHTIGSRSSGDFHPFELAVDAGYSRMFTDCLSGGLALRYIHSELVPVQNAVSGGTEQVGRSVAGDVGLYYQSNIQPEGLNGQWAFGLNISNIGPPVSYSKDTEGLALPTNLRLGGRYSFSIDENHKISVLADLNKLLVPTPGVYELDTLSNELILIRGKEDPSSVIRGMYQSFYDAPGVLRSNRSYSVIAEEMHEIVFSLGAEYWYKKRLAIRSGYHHEHASKGNREYFTIGAGARYKVLTFDISYLLPVDGKNSPMFNTFSLSLTVELNT